MLVDALTAVLAGPLVAAGAAKLLTPPGKLDWPVGNGPWGPRTTGAAEVAAAVAVVALPGRPAALVALLTYLALTGVALALRGTRCACFGTARLAPVGRAHVALNGTAAVVAALLLAAGPGSATAVRATAAAAATAATAAAVLLLDRRARRRAATAARVLCDLPVLGVRIYVTDGCPSCRSLKQLLETVEPARRETVVMIEVGQDEQLPAPLTGLGVPCAVGVDASGGTVCSPAEGIGAVKALVDGITVRAAASDGARAGEDSRVG